MRRFLAVDPDSIVRYCVIALIALTPAFFVPLAWVTVAQAKMLLLALVLVVALVSWCLARYRERALAVPRGWMVPAAAGLPIMYAISALVSHAGIGSFVSGIGEQDTVATTLMLLAVLFLTAVAFKSAYDASVSLFRALIGGGLALLAMQFLHVALPTVSFGVFTGNAASIFGTWHELGILIGLFVMLPFTLWETPVLEGYWRRLALGLGIASFLMLFIINMTDVWFVLGALLIGYGLYGIAQVRQFRFGDTRETRALLASILGVVSLLFGANAATIYQHLPGPLQIVQIEVRPSWLGTIQAGQKLFTSATPLVFGSGPNTFDKTWSLYKPQTVNATDFWNVDFNAGVGTLPTVLFTVGLIGVLAWLLLIAALGETAVRFFRSKTPSFTRPMFGAALFSALYLFVFYIMYVPSIGLSMLTFVLLGYLAYADRGLLRMDFSIDPRGIAQFAVGGALALAAFASAALTLRATASDALVNRSSGIYTRGHDIGSALGSINAALFIWPRNDRAHRAAVELGILQLQEFAALGTDSGTLAKLQTSLAATIKHGLAAVAINDADYHNWLALADYYHSLGGVGVTGAYDNAKAAYQKAHDENPANPLPLLRLAQISLAQKSGADALAYLSQAIELKPDFSAAYLVRSQAEAAAKTYDSALADAQSAASYAPSDASTWYSLGNIAYAAGRYDVAQGALEKAVALQADYANALFMLGLTYEKRGARDDALRVLSRVAELNPADASVSAILADIQSQSRAASSTNPVHR